MRTSPIGPDGSVILTIKQAQIFCGGRELTDLVDQQIAWIFLNYDDWEPSEPEAIVRGDQLDAVHFRWKPQADHGQGFEIVGSLSRMFARYFTEQTVKSEDVVRLQAPMVPDWFIPLARWDHKGRALPLWRFAIQPNHDGE
jgi:hypothetical protein